LAIAGHVDDVLLTGRPHNTDRQALQRTVERLEHTHTSPAGWVIIAENGAKVPSLHSRAPSNGAQRRRRSRPRTS
jgi:hypothetical protein